MKKKTKKKLIISGIILLGILLAGILIYFGFFSQSFLNINEATTYGTVSYSKDIITYSDIDRQGAINGFTNTHRNSEYSSQYFEYSSDNKGLFAPYLEYNGLDSSNFNAGGYKPLICAFTPKDITPTIPIYKNELESLGFTYISQEEGYITSTGGDAGLCNYDGCCAECWTGYGCSGSLNRACVNGGFEKYVKTGYNACWTGNYQSSKLNTIASKMDCFVEGTVNSLCTGEPVGASDRCTSFSQDYSIKGIVSYSNGFICEVDVAVLKAQLPRTMIQPSDGLNKTVEKIGITGTVKFKVKEVAPPEQLVAYYRFADNTCTKISILPSLKTENDYLTLPECEFNIVPPKPILLFVVIGIVGIFIISIIIYALRRKHRRK